MATSSRQSALFGVNDWKAIYQTFNQADFRSYDYETLRKSFIDYLRAYYPETFNDYIESSEFIALLDVMAFMGQGLAFRNDLNARENFIDTAERRDSVIKLANLVSYTPKRNLEAQGYLKVTSVRTTQNIIDLNGFNLGNVPVLWNDPANPNWLEQYNTIINAALINTQRVGLPANSSQILGVKTDEYTLQIPAGTVPVVPFSTLVNGLNMNFELCSVSTVGTDYVYEIPPAPTNTFNMLYRNDKLGYGSPNTGFFFYFKQGTLTNFDFTLQNQISNQVIDIGDIQGVNNTDTWLYQISQVNGSFGLWKIVDNIYADAYLQTESSVKQIYSVNSRFNDQVSYIFGDGVFSQIPVGTFRAYVRAGNALTYTIQPTELQGLSVSINYVSRVGRIETLTVGLSLQVPVSNAQVRESLANIKQRAPSRYYTQNRMVNGEDYNLFPYTQYNSIIKSKALNRASIGTSRYLDLVDNTGKYSSTNTFSSDGALWRQNILPTILFSYDNRNDISDVITNQVQPALIGPTVKQFYYENFPRITSTTVPTNITWLSGYTWNQSTTMANETTGYFRNTTISTTWPNGTPIPVGDTTTTMFKYVIPGALIKFVPPTGYYFDRNNRLVQGTATRADERMEIWASPQAIVGDGYNGGLGNLPSGAGPVTINNFVPTGAIVDSIIPLFVTDLPNSVEQAMTEQILLNRNFGLGYDSNGDITGTPYTWYIITSTNLKVYESNGTTVAAWSQQYADQNAPGLDSSWLVSFVIQNQNYTITFRGLAYNFGSVLQTRFFFYEDQLIYDSRTGTIIKDFVNILAVNTQPDSTEPLPGDIYTTIIGQPVESDGYVDDFQVLVSYRDSDNDGVPDNPDFFNEVVGPATTAGPYVFLQETVDFDNLQRYLLVEQGVVIYDYSTLDEIELAKTEWTPGQVFYAYGEDAFYQLSISATGVRTIVAVSGWIARTGRQSLYFQYRHNSPLTNRIDPGTTNIIDLYVVTLSYYTAYQNWLRDTTGTVLEPEMPTIDELSTEYQRLQDYKMISDNIVINSVVFKPLFGAKAAQQLRATIKVIRAQNSTASTSEIKSAVLAEMNAYFSIDKWNFGDTFYFSELAAYLHRQLGTIISSVVLVPLDQQKSFGDLYEIRSQPNEIFANGATIDNIDVIEALTSTNLRTAPGSGVI